MSQLSYDINKGVNRPIEFKGLKAQYIYYLAIGLALLLICFAAMYIAGAPVYICVPLVLLAGAALVSVVFRYSQKYGEYGLMKKAAFRKVPSAIVCRTRKVFIELGQKEERGQSDGSDISNSRNRVCSSHTAQ